MKRKRGMEMKKSRKIKKNQEKWGIIEGVLIFLLIFMMIAFWSVLKDPGGNSLLSKYTIKFLKILVNFYEKIF